jgi:SAM-dependent methyltransferase
MYQGFPVSLISLMRCSSDEAELRLVDAIGSESFVWQGQLKCNECARKFAIDNGVVRLLDEQLLHAESHKEMQLRDEKSESFARLQRKEWRSDYDDETEIKPTICELQPLNGKVVAEYGCGTGRYTLKFGRQAAAVLAIDFSMASLCVLSQKANIGENTGLVQADVTTSRFAPKAFDRILSTLHSNLPTQNHRMSANRLAARILKNDGRYVFSMHYHGLRDLILGVPKSGYYPENGIYRYHMRAGEAKRETLPYFAQARFYPIKVGIPGVNSIYFSKIVQKVPLLSEMAQLLLGVAEKPLQTQ